MKSSEKLTKKIIGSVEGIISDKGIEIPEMMPSAIVESIERLMSGKSTNEKVSFKIYSDNNNISTNIFVDLESDGIALDTLICIHIRDKVNKAQLDVTTEPRFLSSDLIDDDIEIMDLNEEV